MAILSKPSRSYAAVDHDPNGLSEAGSVPYAYKHELKTFRPPLSETHLKRPGGLDGHHGSSFSPLPNAFMSSRQRKQLQEEGRRAEAEHMLDPDFRSTSNFSLDDSQAGPSRKSSRTAGGMLGGSVMRGTSSLSNFKGPGKKSQLSGVYVDAEGKMHDTEFDPFAAVAEMTRNKSRRRSAFGSERKRGSDSESTSSEESVDKSGSRPLADAKRNEEALRQRRDSERKRFEDISGQAMKRRQSILSQRSGEERTTPSVKSTDEGAMSVLQHYHLDRLNNRTRSSQGSIHQGSLHRSPLSPTFGHSPSSPLPTVADTDERPEKSTETTSMPPPAVPKSKVEIKPGGTKKVTGFDAPESPHPSSTIQTPRSASHLALSPARMSTSSRASRASTETAGERTKPAERPREEIFPETPAQTKKREERQRRQARLGYGGGASSSTRLMESRAASSGARVLPEIEILDDDDPRVVIPTDGRSTRLQTKYTQADHVIRPFASSSVLDRPSSLRSVGLAGSGTKAPSEILDEGHGGYVPTRWAKGDKLLRVTEDEKERYRPKEWGGKTGDLAGKPEEWRPTAKEVLKKEWKDFSTHARFGLFKASKKLSRKADM